MIGEIWHTSPEKSLYGKLSYVCFQITLLQILDIDINALNLNEHKIVNSSETTMTTNIPS